MTVICRAEGSLISGIVPCLQSTEQTGRAAAVARCSKGGMAERWASKGQFAEIYLKNGLGQERRLFFNLLYKFTSKKKCFSSSFTYGSSQLLCISTLSSVQLTLKACTSRRFTYITVQCPPSPPRWQTLPLRL